MAVEEDLRRTNTDDTEWAFGGGHCSTIMIRRLSVRRLPNWLADRAFQFRIGGVQAF